LQQIQPLTNITPSPAQLTISSSTNVLSVLPKLIRLHPLSTTPKPPTSRYLQLNLTLLLTPQILTLPLPTPWPLPQRPNLRSL
jgi:hypothetical protein